MEKWTKIGQGNDSTVYLSEYKQQVMKVYDGVISGLCLEDRFKILNQYSSDTLRAAELVNQKFSRRGFRFGWKNYDLKITILAQGDITLIMPENVDELPRQGLKNYTVSIGQKYIECAHLDKIRHDYKSNFGNSVFHHSMRSFDSSMIKTINAVQELLQKNLSIDIHIVEANVKPTLDRDNGLMDIVITDLADCLPMIYRI